FQSKMAIPTLIALVHDVLMTIGVYSISGLEVTPATVVALLTILGYSIYDGIVVFDKVHENSRLVSSTNRVSYGDMVNLSRNQTLMRSLNTSITALIPITSLLLIGSLVLGATTLEEFGLALLIGLASGAYSSIFIASPLLAIYKEREPRYRDIQRRMASSTTRRAVRSTVDLIADHFEGQRVDRVLGVEARGFIIAAPVAYKFGAAFVPVRKAGKLPWEIERVDYELEYGTDLLEIHRDAVDPGDSVVIVDDVLATGGTASATIRLVEKLGGTVA